MSQHPPREEIRSWITLYLHHNYIIFSEFGFATWDVKYALILSTSHVQHQDRKEEMDLGVIQTGALQRRATRSSYIYTPPISQDQQDLTTSSQRRLRYSSSSITRRTKFSRSARGISSSHQRLKGSEVIMTSISHIHACVRVRAHVHTTCHTFMHN